MWEKAGGDLSQGNTISKGLLRVLLYIGINGINKMHRSGEQNIGEARRKIQAPEQRRILFEVHKPKLKKGFLINDDGIFDFKSQNEQDFDIKLIIFDGAILFPLIRGYSYFKRNGKKVWDTYRIEDAWALQEIDAVGLKQGYFIGDMNWGIRYWDVMLEELRARIRGNILLRKAFGI